MINFLLFVGCLFFFNMMIVGLIFSSALMIVISLLMFCFLYYALKMNPDEVEKVQKIELTYRNGDEVVVEDDFPYFNRDDFKMN